jgi:single-strand DNA-binding protein
LAFELNTVIVGVTLGADAELKQMQNGNSVLSFRGASNRSFVVNGEKQERTSWFRFSLFGTRAEKLAQYLTKGTTIVVNGRLEQRNYEDKDGNKREIVEIIVNELTFVPRGGGGNGGNRGQYNQTQSNRNSSYSDDVDEDFEEVPF